MPITSWECKISLFLVSACLGCAGLHGFWLRQIDEDGGFGEGRGASGDKIKRQLIIYDIESIIEKSKQVNSE